LSRQKERLQHKSRGSLPPSKYVITRTPVSAWCKAFRNGRVDLLVNQHRHLNISLRAMHDMVQSTCGYGNVPAHCIPQQLGEQLQEEGGVI